MYSLGWEVQKLEKVARGKVTLVWKALKCRWCNHFPFTFLRALEGPEEKAGITGVCIYSLQRIQWYDGVHQLKSRMPECYSGAVTNTLGSCGCGESLPGSQCFPLSTVAEWLGYTISWVLSKGILLKGNTHTHTLWGCLEQEQNGAWLVVPPREKILNTNLHASRGLRGLERKELRQEGNHGLAAVSTIPGPWRSRGALL